MFGFFRNKGKEGERTAYTPPDMPPYPADYDGVVRAFAPYYHEKRPLDFFFEMYVVDVLDELPQDTLSALAEFSSGRKRCRIPFLLPHERLARRHRFCP